MNKADLIARVSEATGLPKATTEVAVNTIFTAITDSIAWDMLPREVFRRLFRQDLLLASLFCILSTRAQLRHCLSSDNGVICPSAWTAISLLQKIN